LMGIPPAPRGVPQIEVTFDIDANGIVNVSAKDEATGKEQRITITANSGLDDKDIERMVEEGKSHEDEDKKRREQVELRNKADQLCYGVEKALVEAKDKLPADKVSNVESMVSSLREAIEKEDYDAIAQRMSTLEAAMGEIAQAAYGAQPPPDAAPGGAAPSAGGGGSSGGDDDVIDAEFEETN
ncbi:MAG: Hsp70 family protein, partial [Myxococcales bacterium]|nr:Hsp70 family protein [Myxococcales bacterium]